MLCKDALYELPFLLQLALLNREQREALLRSKRTRLDPAIGAHFPGITVGEAVASLEHAFKVSSAAILRAVRQLRQCVSGAVMSTLIAQMHLPCSTCAG